MIVNMQKIQFFFSALFLNLLSIKYLTFKKLINLFLLRISYINSFFKINNNTGLYPYFISLEPANFCQLQCPECPVGLRYFTQEKHELINKNVAFEVIDELKDNLIHIIFYFQGEPLLNKDLCTYIKYAHDANIFTSTSTNAQALNYFTAKNIVESGLDKIIISIDGTTQEVYEQYRIGGKLSKAIEGIKFIQEWKLKLKSRTPFIEIQFIVFKTNEHQLSDIYKLAKNLKINNIAIKTAQLYNFENGNSLLTSLKKYARYKKQKNGQYAIKSKLPNHCWRMWSGGVINTKGELLPCCFDKNSSNNFGNISSSTFMTIWHNDKSKIFRNKLLADRKQFDMCKNCTSV